MSHLDLPGKGVMPIKTRADIYGWEASEILREISMYPGVQEIQLCRFHPGKEEKVKTQLAHLLKQGRIEQELSGGYVPKGGFTCSEDQNMVKAVWVLLDFIEQVEYHAACDFPVKIVFFREGEEFEIIYVPYGQERLITQVMRMHKESAARRIVIVDMPQQIPALVFSNISGYCTVSADGQVSYYQKRNGGR